MFILWNVLFAFADNNINISPIVQIISYKDVYGKYAQMLGWGSASIINGSWTIITNNHVVTDESWNEITSFNVCMTKVLNTKPECNYTATLIARDENMDIAILRIDEKDIFGNDVEYTKFNHIDIDFDYSPKAQDEVISVWYPWIGADTITETKWIVSWIIEYNGYKYIKTDSLIEWGNSWGWLLTPQRKLVWMPTFGIWNWATLWYSLLLSEAKDFIQQNIDKTPEEKKTNVNFSQYKKTIDEINSWTKINDDIFDITFSKNYEVRNYVPNTLIDMKTSKNNDKIISSISIKIVNLPDMSKDKNFYYLLDLMGLYDKTYQKLIKQKIWGKDFFNPVYLDDKSSWEANGYKTYFGKLDNNNLVVINIVAQSEEKDKDNINKEVQAFLWGINFKTDKKITPTFETYIPHLKTTWKEGFSLNDYEGSIVWFLWNLHEMFAIAIYEKSLISGKWKDIKSVYETETRDIQTLAKSMLSLKWHEWFMYCTDTSMWYGSYKDEDGNALNQSSCIIKIYNWFKSSIDDREFYLYIMLKTDKNNEEKNLDKVIDYLKNDLEIESIWDWETNIPNVFREKIQLKYSDLWDQAKDYTKKLELLTKYWLIKNSDKFEPYKALKWYEFLTLYFKMVYNFDVYETAKTCKTVKCIFEKYEIEVDGNKTNLYSIIDDMWINLYDYVQVSQLDYFETVLKLKLSWAKLKNFSEEEIARYSNFTDEPVYQDVQDKVNQFNNKIYWDSKISIYDVIGSVIDFFPTKTVYYSKTKWLYSQDLYSTEKLNFTYQYNLDQDYLKCFSQTQFSDYQKCVKDYYDNTYWSVEVLTKASAIDYIINLMDFALFDPVLASKKEVNIDEDTNISETFDAALEEPLTEE